MFGKKIITLTHFQWLDGKKNRDSEKANPRGGFSKSNIGMQRAGKSRDNRSLTGEGPGEGLSLGSQTVANKIRAWGWGPRGSMFCAVGTLTVGKSLLQTRGARVWEVSRGLLRTRFLAAAQSFWLSRPGWHLTGASLTGSRSCDAAGPGHRTTVSLDSGLGILSLGEKTKLQGLFES